MPETMEKKLSDFHKLRISQGMKGIKFSTIHKLRISNALKGKLKSLQTRLRMSEAGKRKVFSEKHKKNLSEAKKGEKNPRYRGGKYRLKLPIEEWFEIRLAVLRRDGWTCQRCGENANDVELHIHHIKPYRVSENNDLSNLVTLCESCHIRVEAKLWSRNRKGRFTKVVYA